MLKEINNICVVVVIREYYNFNLFLNLVVYKTLVILVYTSISIVHILQLYNFSLLYSRNLIRFASVVVKQKFCIRNTVMLFACEQRQNSKSLAVSTTCLIEQ